MRIASALRLILAPALVAFAADCSASRDVASAPAPPFAHGSPWPKFRGNAAQDGASRVRPSASSSPRGARWDFATGKGIFSSPIVAADGTIYVGSADRFFYALAKDGSLRWKVETGEIIDSAALLDDAGRVYFGSGDGKLRALDAATGREAWTFTADDPSVNKAFINWFEGNVAMGPSGMLYVPNDNFFVYAIDRATGVPAWRFKMPDQTWSLPAIDPATETLFIGNNNLLPALGKNTFAIDRTGGSIWASASLGTVAASPMRTPDGKIVVGGFDGYVRAYDAASGDEIWRFATRDHIYASPARLPDGTIVQASTDGTIYALDAATGAPKWTYDVREPVRSSPSVDADGRIYVGLGEGRLLVLNGDGSLRWSMRLIDDERNDLNASPALGQDAIYIAGESGQIFSVPYDWCLSGGGGGGASDARCAASEPLPADGASLLYTTRFGALLDAPPASIDANAPVTLTLFVKKGGARQLAILDAASLRVTTDPPSDVDVTASGDGKFVTITPKSRFARGVDGAVSIAVHAATLVELDRAGLKLSGGKPGEPVDRTLRFALNAPPSAPAAIAIPKSPGDAASTWEVSRLSVPLPTIMPSYNQIGFDSLHYLLGVVEGDASRGVAWMAGAKLDAEGRAAIDPATKALFPFEMTSDGAGLVTLRNEDGLRVEVMSNAIPFKSFVLAMRVGALGDATAPAALTGSTVCGGVPFYGPFLQTLGLCNPQTDVIAFAGAANVTRWGSGTVTAPPGIGDVTFAKTTDGGGAIRATLVGSSMKLAEHSASLLVVDASTGKPVTLGYGLDTTRTAAAGGELASVTVPTAGHALPAKARVYLIVDTYPAAKSELTL